MPSDSPADFPGRSERRRYPLAVHIATLFSVLLLAAGLSIGGLAYQRSVTMLTQLAADLFDRIAHETTEDVQSVVTPRKRSSTSWRRPGSRPPGRSPSGSTPWR